MMIISQLTDIDQFRLDIATLALPVFSTYGGEQESFEYRDSRTGAEIIVSPGDGIGRPSVLDRDVLTYCQTIIRQRYTRLELAEMNEFPSIEFTIKDFAFATNRNADSCPRYLIRALDRLAATTIRTKNVIIDNEELARHVTHIIDEYSMPQPGKRRQGRGNHIVIRVKLARWVWRALIKNFIRIDPSFFGIKRAIARRLAEIGSVYVGTRKAHTFSIEQLCALVGSPLSRSKLIKVMQAQAADLEAVGLELTFTKDSTSATFRRLKAQLDRPCDPPPIDDRHLLIPLSSAESFMAEIESELRRKGEDISDNCPQDLYDMRKAALAKMDNEAVK